MPVTRTFPHLTAAINEQSWEWPLDNEPLIAAALQNEVATGADPEAVRRFVMRQTGRAGIAARLEQAAGYLANGGGDGE